jgi:hypothetical protein
MNDKSTHFQKIVLQRVDELLHFTWDPIGVREMPQARDEYQAYVPKVAGFLLQHKKKEELEAYLHWLATEHMGLTDTNEGRAHTKKVVEILYADFDRMRKTPIQSPATTRGK